MVNYTTADEALRLVQSGNRVFIHGSAATPVHLIKSLQARHNELENIELVSITNMGEIDFFKPEYRKSFFFNSLFVSANTRAVANSNDGDYVPIFLSEIPLLFRKKDITGGCSTDTGFTTRYTRILFAGYVGGYSQIGRRNGNYYYCAGKSKNAPHPR